MRDISQHNKGNLQQAVRKHSKQGEIQNITIEVKNKTKMSTLHSPIQNSA